MIIFISFGNERIVELILLVMSALATHEHPSTQHTSNFT